MSFCNNCGKELKPGATFCNNCGIRVKSAETAGGSEALVTCVHCGSRIDASKKICPYCDSLMTPTQPETPDSAVETFHKQVADLEDLISRTPAPKNGKLTDTDKQLISLINNFVVPNKKEEIEGFLILSKTKADAAGNLYSHSNDRHTENLMLELKAAWQKKFDQTAQIASMLFKGEFGSSKTGVAATIEKKIEEEKKSGKGRFVSDALLAAGTGFLAIKGIKGTARTIKNIMDLID